MNKVGVVIISMILVVNLFSQEKINFDNISIDRAQFIFYGSPEITKTTSTGESITDAYQSSSKTITAPQNAVFVIHKILNDGTYIIKFLLWDKHKNVFESYQKYRKTFDKYLMYNVKTSDEKHALYVKENKSSKEDSIINSSVDEVAYFKISKADLSSNAYIYNPKVKNEFTYGTISYLARFRPGMDSIATRWSTDLNLGLSFGYKRNLSDNWALSLLFGLSITKVTMDSISTRGFIKTNIEKASLTPSINFMCSYKMFSLGVGMGWDIVNEDTPEVKKWVYNNRAFFSVGLGINIFSPKSDSKTEAKDQ